MAHKRGTAKDAVGRYGERVAARMLEEMGWRVLDRNWRGSGGEADIIAVDGDELVVVEVKARRSDRFGPPAEAVTRAKLTRLRRLAAEWLSAHPGGYAGVRVDVVAVMVNPSGGASVEHLRGVT